MNLKKIKDDEKWEALSLLHNTVPKLNLYGRTRFYSYKINK